MRPSLVKYLREFQAQFAGVPTTPTGYHQWHRSLAAELGRFVGRDPVGYEGGINLHEYVSGSPLARLDPTGLGWRDTLECLIATRDLVSATAGTFVGCSACAAVLSAGAAAVVIGCGGAPPTCPFVTLKTMLAATATCAVCADGIGTLGRCPGNTLSARLQWLVDRAKKECGEVNWNILHAL